MSQQQSNFVSTTNNVSEEEDSNKNFFTKHAQEFLDKSQFLFLRHAETHGNRDYMELIKSGKLPKEAIEEKKCDIHYLDTDLGPHGLIQANLVQPHINKFTFADDVIFVSPYRRCIYTAFLALQSHPKRQDITFVFVPLAKEVFYTAGNIPVSVEDFESYSLDLKAKYGFGKFDFSQIKALGNSWFLKVIQMDDETARKNMIERIDAGEDHIAVVKELLTKRLADKHHAPAFLEPVPNVYSRTDKFKQQLLGYLKEYAAKGYKVEGMNKICVISHSMAITAFSANSVSEKGKLEDSVGATNAELIPFYYNPELAKIQGRTNPFVWRLELPVVVNPEEDPESGKQLTAGGKKLIEKIGEHQKQKAQEEFVIQNMGLMFAVSSKLTMGSIVGYMMGNFFKQITDKMIMFAGMGTLLVGGLSWMNWITINWKQIDHDSLSLWSRAKNRAQESGATAKFKRFMVRTMPLLGGFSAGFYFGFVNE